jgi:hypothetical protein
VQLGEVFLQLGEELKLALLLVLEQAFVEHPLLLFEEGLVELGLGF